MRKYQPFTLVLVVSIISISCLGCASIQAPNVLDSPTASGLIPANMDPVIGVSAPAVSVDQNWNFYKNDDLDLTLNYPPDWQAITSTDVPGVGLYPPGSDPNLPSPAIKIEWLDIPYSPDQPLEKTGSLVDTIEISGVAGRYYQDSEFTLPSQSHYIEMSYRDGILFFITTIGPSVNLFPQLEEILGTLILNASALGTLPIRA